MLFFFPKITKRGNKRKDEKCNDVCLFYDGDQERVAKISFLESCISEASISLN